MSKVDDFNVHNESIIQSPKKKSHGTLWTLLLAAVIALACGYLGSYLANLQPEDKVVLQKVEVSGEESSITPAVETAKENGVSGGKLEVNDRLISINGYMIRTTEDLTTELAEHNPGDSVKLTIDRDGRLVETEIVLARGEKEE